MQGEGLQEVAWLTSPHWGGAIMGGAGWREGLREVGWLDPPPIEVGGQSGAELARGSGCGPVSVVGTHHGIAGHGEWLQEFGHPARPPIEVGGCDQRAGWPARGRGCWPILVKGADWDGTGGWGGGEEVGGGGEGIWPATSVLMGWVSPIRGRPASEWGLEVGQWTPALGRVVSWPQ